MTAPEEDLGKIKSIDSKEEDLGLKDIEIKIILTPNGYRIEPPMDAKFLKDVLSGIVEDLFVQLIFNREDAPFMRKIERPKSREGVGK